MHPEKTKKNSFIKKHKILTIIIFIVVAIITIVLYPRPSQPLETHTIKKQNLTQSLSATGKIDSQTKADLTFATGGKLIHLNTKEGDHVEKGQIIATLDQRSTQQNLETALRDYSKQRNTFDQTIDNNQGRTPEQSLNNTMKRILQDNQFDLEKAVLSVELRSLAKEQSILTSPITGIIIRQDVDTTGVNIALTTTFTVADPNNLIFKMDIDEADIGNIHSGQQINLLLNAFPDRKFKLKITKIAFSTHATDTGGEAYIVEAKLPNNDDLDYRIGMNGDAEIILVQKQDIPTVPISSLTDDDSVYLKNSDNTFTKRKIKLGIQNDIDAEILSGLNPGDQVALQPAEAETSNTSNPMIKIPFH